MPALPLELVFEVLQATLGLSEIDIGNARTNTKPPFHLISSLSLTCKLYRGLTLEAWFRQLYTENPKDTVELTEHIPQAKKTWVRRLHCVNPIPSDPRYYLSWDLEGYEKLGGIRLDWLSNGIPHQGNSLERSDYLPFINAPHTVTTFDFRNVRWPYPTAYLFISQCLPSVKKLVLHQRKIWCGLCFTVSRVNFAPPTPRRLAYEDGLGLPVHYAKALSHLQFLECVSIYTPAYESGFASVRRAQDEFLWVGECDWCMRLFFKDPSYLDAYVSRKKQKVFRMADGTERSWPHPPRLRSVEWIFTPVTPSGELTESYDDTSEVEDIDTDPESEEVDVDYDHMGREFSYSNHSDHNL